MKEKSNTPRAWNIRCFIYFSYIGNIQRPNEPKMKVLALHGLGSSAVMLEQQLAAVMDDLGPNYKFVFLDGSFPCESGPGELEHHTTLV